MRKDLKNNLEKVLIACYNSGSKGIRYTKLKEETGLSDRTVAEKLEKLQCEKLLKRGRLKKEDKDKTKDEREYIGTFVYDKTYFLTPKGEFLFHSLK